MKIEFVAFGPPEMVLDTIDWPPNTAPTYATGKAQSLVEGLAGTLTLGMKGAREVLGALDGWSNGYVLCRRV